MTGYINQNGMYKKHKENDLPECNEKSSKVWREPNLKKQKY